MNIDLASPKSHTNSAITSTDGVTSSRATSNIHVAIANSNTSTSNKSANTKHSSGRPLVPSRSMKITFNETELLNTQSTRSTPLHTPLKEYHNTDFYSENIEDGANKVTTNRHPPHTSSSAHHPPSSICSSSAYPSSINMSAHPSPPAQSAAGVAASARFHADAYDTAFVLHTLRGPLAPKEADTRPAVSGVGGVAGLAARGLSHSHRAGTYAPMTVTALTGAHSFRAPVDNSRKATTTNSTHTALGPGANNVPTLGNNSSVIVGGSSASNYTPAHTVTVAPPTSTFSSSSSAT